MATTMAMQQLRRNMAKKLGAMRAFSGFTAKSVGGGTAAPSHAVAQWPLSAGSEASFLRGHAATRATSIRHFSTGAELPGGGRMGLWAQLKKMSVRDHMHYQACASAALIISTALYYGSRYYVDNWGPLITRGLPKK